MFGFNRVGKKYRGNSFLAFGAAGEVAIREAESYDVLDWEEGPMVLFYLKSKEGTIASWRIGAVVPLNKKARCLMATVIWKRDGIEYKEWRKKYSRKTFPSFKKIKSLIEEGKFFS